MLNYQYGRAKKPMIAAPNAMVRRSSVVEQLTVNQLVVGSNPTAGAKKILLPALKLRVADCS